MEPERFFLVWINSLQWDFCTAFHIQRSIRAQNADWWASSRKSSSRFASISLSYRLIKFAKLNTQRKHAFVANKEETIRNANNGIEMRALRLRKITLIIAGRRSKKLELKEQTWLSLFVIWGIRLRQQPTAVCFETNKWRVNNTCRAFLKGFTSIFKLVCTYLGLGRGFKVISIVFFLDQREQMDKGKLICWLLPVTYSGERNGV